MGLGKHHIQVSDKTEIDMIPTEFKKQVEDVIKKNVQECKEIIKRVCELEYEKGYKDAYIRALKESIAIMDENGWHEISDGLPPRDEDPKCKDFSVHVLVTNGCNQQRAFYDFARGEWNIAGFSVEEKYEVTHWRMLPPLPPKKAKI